jgi:hypothetical protein
MPVDSSRQSITALAVDELFLLLNLPKRRVVDLR